MTDTHHETLGCQIAALLQVATGIGAQVTLRPRKDGGILVVLDPDRNHRPAVGATGGTLTEALDNLHSQLGEIIAVQQGRNGRDGRP